MRRLLPLILIVGCGMSDQVDPIDGFPDWYFGKDVTRPMWTGPDVKGVQVLQDLVGKGYRMTIVVARCDENVICTYQGESTYSSCRQDGQWVFPKAGSLDRKVLDRICD